jgi:hypothetical protein
VERWGPPERGLGNGRRSREPTARITTPPVREITRFTGWTTKFLRAGATLAQQSLLHENLTSEDIFDR